MWRRSAARPATTGRVRHVLVGPADANTDTTRDITHAGRGKASATVAELALLCGRSVEQIEAEIDAINDP